MSSLAVGSNTNPDSTNTDSTNTQDTVAPGNTDLSAGLSRLAAGQGQVAPPAAANALSTPAAIKPSNSAFAFSTGTFGSTPKTPAPATPTFHDAGSNTVTQLADGSYVYKTADGHYVDATQADTPGGGKGWAENEITSDQYNSDLSGLAASTAAAQSTSAAGYAAWVASTQTAQTAAAASQQAVIDQQNAFTAGLSTASMMPTSAEDAAASTNAVFGMGLQRMGGGAYGAYANATGQAGASAVEAGTNTLAKAQDQQTQLNSESAFLSSALSAQLQTHTQNAQQSIQMVQDSLDALGQQIDSMSGEAQAAAKAQMVQLQGLIQTLQTQYGADQQADANFWTLFGTATQLIGGVAATVSKAGTAA